MKKYQVVTICNALVDILGHVEEETIASLGIEKGVMHLVDGPRQEEILGQLQSFSLQKELGGSGLNTIRALAQLGHKTAFGGQIGSDAFGTLIAEKLQELGIDANLNKCQTPTGTSLILITPDGERTMNTCLGASRLYDRSLVPTDSIKDSRIFHFCGYQWDTDQQIETIKEAIRVAKAAGTKISFDVADPFVVQRHRETFLEVIDQEADIVFANEEESKMLFNASPEEAGKAIAKTGAIAVIKLGAKGAMICKGSEVHMVQPVMTDAIDTTAAGDMFAAGFLHGFSNDLDFNACGVAAATLASDVISRTGAIISEHALSKVRGIQA